MFYSARIKLTFWYLLIIMLISITFSTVIYRVLVVEVERFERTQRYRIQRGLEQGIYFPTPEGLRHLPTPLPLNPELIAETKQRILLLLVLTNVGVLALAGCFGFLLAGRTLSPIQKMVEEQNQFISDASHELKTPLTSLKSAFEVFLRNKKRTLTEADTIVNESIGEVNKLQSLSESLLKLAQYQQPNGHTVFTKVSLNQIIATAIKKMQPQAAEKNLTLLYTPGYTQYVCAFHDDLVSLMTILLDNAIKYSKTKSPIKIFHKKVDGSVLISVVDCGIGIGPGELPHIFDRFYRADSARSQRQQGGYGLGLAIAQKIAQMHKGTLSVESKLGKGSTFTLHLPIKT